MRLSFSPFYFSVVVAAAAAGPWKAFSLDAKTGEIPSSSRRSLQNHRRRLDRHLRCRAPWKARFQPQRRRSILYSRLIPPTSSILPGGYRGNRRRTPTSPTIGNSKHRAGHGYWNCEIPPNTSRSCLRKWRKFLKHWLICMVWQPTSQTMNPSKLSTWESNDLENSPGIVRNRNNCRQQHKPRKFVHSFSRNARCGMWTTNHHNGMLVLLHKPRRLPHRNSKLRTSKLMMF